MLNEENFFSIKHQEEIREALDALHIPSTEIPLCEELDDRPQVTLNPETGEVKLLEMGERDLRIELLQMYEYRLFREVLQVGVPDYFEAKEAERMESQLFPVKLGDLPSKWVERVEAISDEALQRICYPLMRPDREFLEW